MKSFFITGIPAAGKSYFAKKLSKEFNIPILSTDDLRKEMTKITELKKWVNYYWDTDEKEYYTKTSCSDRWQDMIRQSEAFWQFTKGKIIESINEESYIIEGVNLLPHLIQEVKLQGLVLLGESEATILDRIKANPRWGRTEELQILEADAFFNCEGMNYKKEAKKYNYPVFTNANEAYDYIINLLN